MKKTNSSKRNEVSMLWFGCKLKSSIPNLVIRYTESGSKNWFTIGVYSFNSINGVSHIEPLSGMEKMTYSETLLKITE